MPNVDLAKLHNLAGAVRDAHQKLRPPVNRTQQTWFSIKNVSTDVTSVRIDGFIGDWGVSASDFMSQVSQIDTKGIDVHLNSEGGEVYDAISIYEGLQQMQPKSTITTYVDSLAASAASFIAMAASPYDAKANTGGVRMGRNARMVIHDAALGGVSVFGTAVDLREGAQLVLELADNLDDMSNNIASIYAAKAGGTVAEWRARMSAGTGNLGTTYSAQDAIDAKLADAIIGADKQAPTDEPVTNVVPGVIVEEIDYAELIRKALQEVH